VSPKSRTGKDRRFAHSAIPYATQSISISDMWYVRKAIRANFLTQGPLVDLFESKVSSYVGARHGIAVNSATSGLHLACLALGVGPGDVVWTSAITFVASANCAVYCGANVDFVDIDPKTFNMSVTDLRRKLEVAAQAGNLPKVVIPVHLTGQPSDMESIHAMSKEFGFRIIEDASHAIGSTYKGGRIGSCEFSDITVFSFHPVKIITTGEGGMAMTNDSDIALKLRSLRSHGITRNESLFQNAPDGPWYYEQQELGYNYRMTDLQAALGISQLARIDKFIRRRHKIASLYNSLIKQLPIALPYQAQDARSAFHLYVVQIDPQTRLRVVEDLRHSGILVNLHYIPVYRQPFYAKRGFNLAAFPNAESYYSSAISLPMFPKLKLRQVARICKLLKEMTTRV
jgi:UDP-4-amino-4,6-dideoxy-N-acetyl-beta-L-altrosamine transaminase